VGSSARKSCGRTAMARAIATRCACPAGQFLGSFLASSAKPTRVRVSMAAPRVLPGVSPKISGSSTFSTTLKAGHQARRLEDDGDLSGPQCVWSAQHGPANLARARLIETRIRCKRVDFPLPEGPISAILSPALDAATSPARGPRLSYLPRSKERASADSLHDDLSHGSIRPSLICKTRSAF